MNVIVEFDGREAIPVRAIPLVSNWHFMPPIVLAHVLGDTGGSTVSMFGDLVSYNFESGVARPISKDWWTQFPLKRLQALLEASDGVARSQWEEQSLKVLPPGVFVWKDEYQELHDRNWNNRFRQTYWALRAWDTEDDSDDSEDEVDARVNRLLTRDELADDSQLKRDQRELLQTLKRWEKPDYSPFMEAAWRTMVMEGFELIVANPRPSTPEPSRPVQRTAAQEEAILAMLRSQGINPMMMPKRKPGVSGIKSEIRKALGTGGLWTTPRIFEKAWERLRDRGEIADER